MRGDIDIAEKIEISGTANLSHEQIIGLIRQEKTAIEPGKYMEEEESDAKNEEGPEDFTGDAEPIRSSEG